MELDFSRLTEIVYIKIRNEQPNESNCSKLFENRKKIKYLINYRNVVLNADEISCFCGNYFKKEKRNCRGLDLYTYLFDKKILPLHRKFVTSITKTDHLFIIENLISESLLVLIFIRSFFKMKYLNEIHRIIQENVKQIK